MKRMTKPLAVAALSIALLASSCAKKNLPANNPDNLPNTIVLEWNEIAFLAFDGPMYQHSLMASRINAMTHIAMYDALNAIKPAYEPYAFEGRDPNADPLAAAATAAHTVLLHEIPAKKAFLDSALQKSLADTYGEARLKGIALGLQAAQAILDARKNDGSDGEVTAEIPVSTVPGVYQAVPPFNIVFAPDWENLKLFALSAKDQFRPAPHPALTSARYAADFAEVKAVGEQNSKVRTPDQSEFAKFWYEFSEAGWNRVARTVAADKDLGLLETARLFALVDMALADAYTAGWDAKFYYNFWRPYTAIRGAATDGNESTTPDTGWEPAAPTPPVHDYPSTHSALGNAGATVLARLLGDNTPFSMTSFTSSQASTKRSFSGFRQAADENADSRVMAGIHFRFSCEAGQELGNRIGDWVVDNHLRPLK